MKLAGSIALFFLAIYSNGAFAQPGKDYIQYHKNIINAEREIFINNAPAKGLELFSKTFENYQFVFVDDCIEAFQIALVYKKEDYALRFIKKAIDNGFELKLLNYLSYSCPCIYYADKDTAYVTIYKQFINKNATMLEAYSNSTYGNFLQRIDKNLFFAILKRHVKEQLFKDYLPGLSINQKEQRKEFIAVNDDNMRFIDSLAGKGVFLGEQNLGIYTDKLAASLKLPFTSIETYLSHLLRHYEVPTNRYVPIVKEEAYFEASDLYIIMYHKRGSYSILKKYKNEAIKQGYLHPKEYEMLRIHYSFDNIAIDSDLYLSPTAQNIPDHALVNLLRERAMLPSLEIDSCKHAFAHKHQLQLFFGFFNGGR